MMMVLVDGSTVPENQFFVFVERCVQVPLLVG